MNKSKKEAAVSEAKESAKSSSLKKGGNYFADFNFDELKLDINALFKSGAYFGHQKSRRHPKAKEYIYTTKNGIDIIDLQETMLKIKGAQEFIESIASQGKDVLLVGTKRQAKDVIESAGEACQLPYVVERWLGGTFTNFPTISKRTKHLREEQEKIEKGEYEKYTKFEKMKMKEELERLEEKMGGIKNMKELPGAIFVTGVNEDNLAIKEAQKAGVPIIALVDTNVDSSGIEFPIPANEDAVSSLRLLTGYICQAFLSGKSKFINTQQHKENKK